MGQEKLTLSEITDCISLWGFHDFTIHLYTYIIVFDHNRWRKTSCSICIGKSRKLVLFILHHKVHNRVIKVALSSTRNH